jgi:hypothetical protein
MRRVVTGVDQNGKSIVVSDDEIEPTRPPSLGGNEIYDIFGADEIPHVPSEGADPGLLRFFPAGPGGYRFVIFRYPPDSERTVPDDLEAAMAETERVTPGMGDAVSDASGTHYTATVDLEYVLEGEFTLTLDDGASTVLKQGDALVQCGPRHSWANNSDEWATMLLVFLGGHPHPERHAPASPGEH